MSGRGCVLALAAFLVVALIAIALFWYDASGPGVEESPEETAPVEATSGAEETTERTVVERTVEETLPNTSR